MPWHLSVRTLKHTLSVSVFFLCPSPHFAIFLASSVFSPNSNLNYLWSEITVPWSHSVTCYALSRCLHCGRCCHGPVAELLWLWPCCLGGFLWFSLGSETMLLSQVWKPLNVSYSLLKRDNAMLGVKLTCPPSQIFCWQSLIIIHHRGTLLFANKIQSLKSHNMESQSGWRGLCQIHINFSCRITRGTLRDGFILLKIAYVYFQFSQAASVSREGK